MPTKKDLENLVKGLQDEISHLTIAHAEDQARMEEDLRTTHAVLAEAQAQVTAAKEATTAAEATRDALQAQIDQAATAAGQGPAPPVDQVNMTLIPRPAGSGWSIRESMQVTKVEYSEIQRTIHSLVIRASLDWTEDFRRQDPEQLSTLFRAACLAHPVLCHYANNWATAAIACQYMQNKRKHAYKQGYISKQRAHQVNGQENVPGGRAGSA